ncbi:MAG: M56 family metallopeptidase [Lachnospiraceae bacterium]|nr:M56 family metallopeptidase [Lachnospiraceae bacterium]
MTEFFQSYFHMAFTASAVVVLILLFRPLFKKFSNRIACLLWLVVLFRLLCPFTIERPTVPKDTTVEPEATMDRAEVTTVPERGTEHDAEEGSGMATGEIFVTENGDDTANLSIEAEPETPGIPEAARVAMSTRITDIRRMLKVRAETDLGKSLTGIGGVLWLIGLAVFLLAGARKYRNTAKELKRAVYLKEWEHYPVWLSDVRGVPMSFGIFRPGIYVPESFREGADNTLPPMRQEMILMHETMHLRHFDPLWKTIAFLALALHWWNPLVWICLRCMNQDLEMACDEAVLQRLGSGRKKEYATTLLEFASERGGIPLIAAFGESPAEKRIRNVIGYRKAPWWICAVLSVVVLFLAGCVTTTAAEETAEEEAAEEIIKEETAEEVMAETERESETDLICGMSLEEIRQMTDRMKKRYGAKTTEELDRVKQQWEQNDKEFWVLRYSESDESYLYGARDGDWLRLVVRIGDWMAPVEPLEWIPDSSYSFRSDDMDQDGQPEFLLRRDTRVNGTWTTEHYIGEWNDGAITLYYLDSEELLSVVRSRAALMGVSVSTSDVWMEFGHDYMNYVMQVGYYGFEVQIYYYGDGQYSVGEVQYIEGMPQG